MKYIVLYQYFFIEDKETGSLKCLDCEDLREMILMFQAIEDDEESEEEPAALHREDILYIDDNKVVFKKNGVEIIFDLNYVQKLSDADIYNENHPINLMRKNSTTKTAKEVWEEYLENDL